MSITQHVLHRKVQMNWNQLVGAISQPYSEFLQNKK
ncbi:MAG: hypothetical protein ACD_36C00102G0004 [uncultured bacterium]|nr:MAG: hypothetical protein ACD_36C00102G0004 [uncultured bacterium]